MRVVLDTNVFISGIFWSGNYCSQLIDKWKNKEIELVSSLDMVGELLQTLRSFKISMAPDIIEEWKDLIIKKYILIEPSSRINVVYEDPDDNKFIEAAVYGKADLIISQDKHLLNLKEYNNIKIVRPKEAISLV